MGYGDVDPENKVQHFYMNHFKCIPSTAYSMQKNLRSLNLGYTLALFVLPSHIFQCMVHILHMEFLS